MPSKLGVFLGITAGSSLGGMVPYLWGADVFSAWGLLFSGIGGIVGVFLVVKIARMME